MEQSKSKTPEPLQEDPKEKKTEKTYNFVDENPDWLENREYFHDHLRGWLKDNFHLWIVFVSLKHQQKQNLEVPYYMFPQKRSAEEKKKDLKILGEFMKDDPMTFSAMICPYNPQKEETRSRTFL